MSENPLLPNAQLRALLSLLRQALVEEQAVRGRATGRAKQGAATATEITGKEALIAGTLLQLEPGDVFVPEPHDRSSATLLPSSGERTADRVSVLQTSSASPQVALAAGMAAALQRSGEDRLVFAYVRAGITEPKWAETLAMAEQSKLPLVVACADPSGSETFRREVEARSPENLPLTWTTAQKLALKAKLPILSVDGEDAVAVYRVMQESVLRARSGGGPALLWAMLPRPGAAGKTRSKAELPLARLERYLRTRAIAF